MGTKWCFQCGAGSISPCQKKMTRTVKSLPWCLTLEEAKCRQRLCCAAEQPATDSEVLEIEHENWASNLNNEAGTLPATDWSQGLPCFTLCHGSCKLSDSLRSTELNWTSGLRSGSQYFSSLNCACLVESTTWSYHPCRCFLDAKPNITFLCPFPLLKKGSAPCSVQQNWTFGFENNLSLLVNMVCPQDFVLHSTLNIILKCC